MRTDPLEFTLHWQGYTIAIAYEPNWLGGVAGLTVAHLQVTTVAPPRAALPFTETGYRSHFVHPEAVEAEGGPVAYVTAWLNAAAAEPAWRTAHAASQQLDLFGGEEGR